MTETFAEQQARVRQAALHAHDRRVASSEETRASEIVNAHALYNAVFEHPQPVFEKIKAELAAATEPDPDPQIEFVKVNQGVAAAANLKIGKLSAAATEARDSACYRAERQHHERVAASSKQLAKDTEVRPEPAA